MEMMKWRPEVVLHVHAVVQVNEEEDPSVSPLDHSKSNVSRFVGSLEQEAPNDVLPPSSQAMHHCSLPLSNKTDRREAMKETGKVR